MTGSSNEVSSPGEDSPHRDFFLSWNKGRIVLRFVDSTGL